jgi:murein DD-endopeptidase MepM/ murein hydrolase activator NlpD
MGMRFKNPNSNVTRGMVTCAFAAAILITPGLFAPAIDAAHAQGKNPRMIVKKLDGDDDGKVGRDEWKKSSEVFDKIDGDGDGYLTPREFKDFFDGGGAKKKQQPVRRTESAAPISPASGGQTPGNGLVGREALDPVTKGAFFQKLEQYDHQNTRGLLESELTPIYPKDHDCPQIDHVFGEDWRGPVPNRKHTGADIPAQWDEPIIAMADGEVVAKFGGEGGFRGLQVIIRHTPEETGLPVWIYTLYSHFSAMPEVEVGQRIRMGDYLGPNGKTGVPGEKREPHNHQTVTYSESPNYMLMRGLVIPVNGHFIDPVALFRGKMPINTHAVRALPESERRVKIAFKTKSGDIVPPDAKIIWPFACGAF